MVLLGRAYELHDPLATNVQGLCLKLFMDKHEQVKGCQILMKQTNLLKLRVGLKWHTKNIQGYEGIL